MKKYLMAMPFAAAALTFAACDDYLDVAPANTLTTESFYKTPAQAEQGLNGVYHDLIPAAYHIFYLAELPSDENYGEWDTERTWSRLCTHDHDITSLDELSSAWTDYYKCIAHANTFLDKVPGIQGFASETVKNQMLGEAYFLRAFSYFELVRYFGNIPLFDHPATAAEALTTGQSDPKAIYELIVSDLKNAKELLNNAPTDYRGTTKVPGKPTQIAATAMLGRVYLTMATHPDVQGGDSYKQLAKAEFASVLAAAGIAEGSNGTPNKFWAKDAEEWQKMFLHENDNKYFIWELQYATDAAKTLGNRAIFEMQPEVYNASFYPVRIFGNKVYVAGDILDEYGHDGTSSYGPGHNADKRADWTVCYLTGNDLVNEQSKQGYSGEPFYTKFLETTPKREYFGLKGLNLVYDDYYKDEINFPILRLEDVMLMYCEVAGYNSYTLHLLNLIRGRQTTEVTAAEAAADWQGIVRRERRLEFAQEGIRWHDQVRNGEIEHKKTMLQKYYNTDYAQVAIKNINSKYYRYAIPQDQINVKEGLYKQNPEYK